MLSVLRKILKKWYVYLLAAVLAVTGSIYYVNFINRAKNQETISLFLGTYTSSTEAINQELKKNAPDYLKEINLLNVKPNDSDFSYYFVNRGLNNADIFVLPESLLTDDMLAKQFAALDKEYVSSYFDYEAESTNHGILIHKSGDADKEIMTFTNNGSDENYYLLFRKNSIHVGKLNNSDYDTALTFAKVLIEHV